MRTGYGEVPLINILPPVWSNEGQHILDETCWCRPRHEFEAVGYVRLVHRERRGSILDSRRDGHDRA